MNIEKEREAFEALPLAKLALDQDWVRYSEDTNSYYPNEDFCPDSAPESMNFAWASWQASALRAAEKLEGCVVVPSNSVTLTCEQLLTVLQYGAPDLHVERTEYSEEQMETEMSIVWLEDGHSGKGYYAYYTELPEEGSINIDLMEEAARCGK